MPLDQIKESKISNWLSPDTIYSEYTNKIKELTKSEQS